MTEIIYGDVNPSGRLPITYPKDPANVAIPYYHRVSTQCAYDHCSMQWDFGAGLSYTEFNYSAVSLDTTNITSADATVTATVTVTNVGTRAGKETVMLFLTQPYRTISVPEVKMLKKFKKIELQPGESQDVSFTLTDNDWSVYDPQIGKGLKKITEDSDFVVAIKPDTWCNVYKNITNPLCAVFTINIGRDIFGLPPQIANVTGTDALSIDNPATIPTEPLAAEVGAGTKITEDSDFVVAIKPDTWCNVYKNITNPLCAVFTINIGRDIFGLPPQIANVTGTDALSIDNPATIPTEPLAAEVGAGTVEAGNY
ncbi:Family 3 Glycosyl hydrolase [Phytophthora palmivora]|uniref:beta-glucosidase n=1 Tax=Phytophthora palmivora TaxID=4796 RepID=A0A2P4WZD8_9STRA|nr:Family 3 Glycosyl hydrolase [Phytophthora palmivora]